jgi:hypothetical protein
VKFQRIRQNPDKRGYLYVITPAGLKAKSQLTYRFLRFTIDFYNKMEEKLQDCLVEMGRQGVKRIVLYGASDAAKIVMDMVGNTGVEVVGVVDDALGGETFNGVRLVKDSGVSTLEWDRILITSLDEVENAEERLLVLGVDAEDICKIA